MWIKKAYLTCGGGGQNGPSSLIGGFLGLALSASPDAACAEKAQAELKANAIKIAISAFIF